MHQILIAEDEARIAAFIEKGLQKHGYHTAVAKDGIEAIAKLRENQFDLLLLDLGLPGQDGWAVLQELRTQIAPNLDVILVTARDDGSDQIKGSQFGVKQRILKPFKFSNLLEQVQALLNN